MFFHRGARGGSKAYAGQACAWQPRKRRGSTPLYIAGSNPALHPSGCMPVGLVAAGSGKQAYLRVRMKTGFVIRPEMRSASLDAASIAGNAYRALSENGYRAKGQTARKQFSAGWRHALKGSAAGQAWMTNHEFRPEEVFYMKKVIINENQKGFLFHNGRFVKLLGAGKYPLFGAREIEISCLQNANWTPFSQTARSPN